MSSFLRNNIFFNLGYCLCFVTVCVAQLTFHNDPLSNSFTLKAPGLQQSFTRYFGGKRGNLVQSSPAALQASPATLQQQLQSQHQQYQQPQYQQLAQYQQQQQQQPQYQQLSQYQPQYQFRQQQNVPFTQQQFSQYSSSAQYQNPSQGQSGYPFEAAYEQPASNAAQQAQTLAQAQAYATQYTPQTTYSQLPAYRGQEYAAAAAPQTAGQPLQPGMPSYGEQMQQSYDSYQQEQAQMQQLLAQQQQHQDRLLMDLYKTPQGQGRPITENGRGNQAFYTADQYINFLNRQHQDVFRQQQTHPERGFAFSPMSAYTNGSPTNSTSPQQNQLGTQYSPASNVSTVNYTNGKLTYNY